MPPVTGASTTRGDFGREEILVEINPDRAQRVGRVIEVADRLASVHLTRCRHELGVDAVARELLPVLGSRFTCARTRSAGDGGGEGVRLEDRVRDRTKIVFDDDWRWRGRRCVPKPSELGATSDAECENESTNSHRQNMTHRARAGDGSMSCFSRRRESG